MNTLHPTHWRSVLGINKTIYSCETCGNSFEDSSGLDFKICEKCGEKSKTKLHKTQVNDRNSLKERAVKMANETFNLNLVYVNKTSKQNQDDIAEAILVGYSYLKERNDVNGR